LRIRKTLYRRYDSYDLNNEARKCVLGYPLRTALRTANHTQEGMRVRNKTLQSPHPYPMSIMSFTMVSGQSADEYMHDDFNKRPHTG
jgi:tryptophan synthase beta subunit